ncbi:MAG TPA: tail fiber protein [Chitinophaga sp.]
MADLPFLSEISMISFNYPPKGYAFCNGQLLPINQNQPLFSLLATTFGGNGQTNFALPDFRGRIPIHEGNGYTLGQVTGSMSNTLSLAQMPQHVHAITATLTLQTGDAATTTSPAGAFLAEAPNGSPRYSTLGDDKMASAQAGDLVADPVGEPLQTEPNSTAATSPFYNMMPYQGIYFIIALQGVFPSSI